MIDLETFDPEKVTLAKSGRAVKLLYDKQPLKFCTVSMYSPFGVKSVNKEWSNFTEYTLDCSVNQKTPEFQTFIEKLDQRIQELVKKNIGFFKGIDEAFAYHNIFRENGNYPKLVKLTLVRDKNGNIQSFVFDKEKNKIKIDDSNVEETLSKGKVFKCIVECGKIWAFSNKVGTVWNINQLKFSEKQFEKPTSSNTEQAPPGYSGYMMLD